LVIETTQYSGKTPYIQNKISIARIDGYYTGLIDEIRVYDRSMTDEEIYFMYNSYYEQSE